MHLAEGKKIYFLSDFHLGSPDHASSLEREKCIIQFLEEIKPTAAEIFIVGDIFDFWYEYRKVVPKGHVRLLGKLAELTDKGIPIHFFVGNHDMWMNDYFQKELNIPIYFEPKSFVRNGQKILVGHGDGLGPGDEGYKFLKKIFRSKIANSLFGLLPPFFGMGLANFLSNKSKAANGNVDGKFYGEENEWLIQYCMEELQKEHYDLMVFGHRHLPIDFKLNEKSRYINLGDWINYFTYAIFDEKGMELLSYKGFDQKIIKK